MTDRVALADLEVAAMIDEGGQGQVFELDAAHAAIPGTRCVVKLYADEAVVSPDSLGALVRLAARLDPGDAALLRATTAWPIQVVEADGRASGIVMQRAPDRFWQTFSAPNGARNKLREASWLFAPSSKLHRFGVPDPDDGQRRTLCHELARVLQTLHANKAVYGDVSARNILWTVAPQPEVFLLDCDGVRRVGAAAPLRQLDSPDWGDPYFQHNQTIESDRYKFGLFVSRVFARSLYETDPAAAARVLGRGAGGMLQRALTVARPADRPTMDDWVSFFATGKSVSAPATEQSAAEESTPTAAWIKGPDGTWSKGGVATPGGPAQDPTPAAAERWTQTSAGWVRTVVPEPGGE